MIVPLLILVAIAGQILAASNSTVDTTLPPVFYLPGYGASALFAKISAPKYIPPSCASCNIPVGESFEIESVVDDDACVTDLLTMIFDPITGNYSYPPGIRVFVENIGSFATIGSNNYVFPKYLESWGYQEGFNLYGVPYDYRLMSDRSFIAAGFIQDVKLLVEKVYVLNGNRRVFFVGHSNGGPTMYTFLQSSLLSADWKKKYVAGMIGLSGNFLGQMNAMYDYTYNENTSEQNMVGSWEGAMGSVTWGGYEAVQDVPIITTYVGTPSERNYTAKMDDLVQLFVDSGRSDWAQQLRMLNGIAPSTENTMDRSRHPEVDVFCLYGSEVKTSYAFQFSTGMMDAKEIKTLYTKGDGDQDHFDNAFCHVWKDQPQGSNYRFDAHAFPGVHHMQMISNPKVLSTVKDILVSYKS